MIEKTNFNPFFQYLQHNEAFVWVGKPVKKRWRKPHLGVENARLLGLLPGCLCVAIPVMSSLLAIVVRNSLYLSYFLMCMGTTLILMLLYHSIYRFSIDQEWERKYSSVYAISNLHLFAWHNHTHRLLSIPIDWVEHATIEIHGEYETIRWFITPPYEDDYIHFDYIKDAQEIINIVADVLARPIPVVRVENSKRRWIW
jgi:hypothetical protein